jgi:hypothetical protein
MNTLGWKALASGLHGRVTMKLWTCHYERATKWILWACVGWKALASCLHGRVTLKLWTCHYERVTKWILWVCVGWKALASCLYERVTKWILWACVGWSVSKSFTWTCHLMNTLGLCGLKRWQVVYMDVSLWTCYEHVIMNVPLNEYSGSVWVEKR